MKNLSIASALTAGLLAALAFPASAQYATQTQADAKAEAQVDTATTTTELDAKAQLKQDTHRNCLRYTGTRIPASRLGDKGCVAANGRVYSREDINRTGEVDIADALRKLDPAIR
ncbi:hypothetical protein ACFQZQ_14560 [Lysobacter koreensis]|uniref:Uncharacterized protein n=1 Tax=Lysobacter koreensis TaxID=266122 RepID=A0ABW2YT54_9GAMM